MTTDKFRKMPAFPEKHVTRFWSKVDRSSIDKCWEWKRYKEPLGYGQVGVPGGQVMLAHRVAYFLYWGVDPAEKCVLHKCDNPPCCNPNHHFLGTRAENTADMINKGRDVKAAPEYVYNGISATDVTFMREMFWCGEFSKSHIARTFCIPIASATHIINGRSRKHIPMPPESKTKRHLVGAPVGSRSASATTGVYENDVFLMREMYCLGNMKATDIAKKYSVTFTSVYTIVTGQSWKHVPFPDGGRPGMRSPRVRKR